MTDTTDTKIAVQGVSKRFESGRGTVTALDGVDFEATDGEFLCIVGPSGCGKTTLFRLIAGFEAPTEGEVFVNDERVTGPGTDRGIVFQDYRLFPWRTVSENVKFGLEQQDDGDRSARENRVTEMLDLVGLDGTGDAYPKELSGGMKQRVGLARALAVDPEILMMDEPFGSVDAQTRETLHTRFIDIWQATQKTVLFTTHEVDEAVHLADRVLVMDANPGRVQEIVEIDLDRPRSRTDDSFAEYAEHVRTLIG
ncbi:MULTISPECIES: ABC transporter ATP-binding protein [unclassified Haladaptatus]|uniref:ABC transporter ATP-binding protein n=1 Tax=unclassified Haladaptatus TaxID=2622732 RepID=UPI00209C59CF|nr:MULTISPECIES: ABC transporter ATP-binding protein [unclassified Haladaptatus]MCO8244836.1 ABC transporter ATP-binding protein [Haladaptatus sp. AB643]MCO8255650.1 ABC transporter ATP-binding protein [Haladaptatus sp. AB618]